jgi:hypothetical protein
LREADKVAKEATRVGREEDKKHCADLIAVYETKMAEWEERRLKGVKGCGCKPASDA